MRRGILGQLDFMVGRATQRTIKLTFLIIMLLRL